MQLCNVFYIPDVNHLAILFNDEYILYEVDFLDKISENYLSASSSRRFLSSLRSLLFYKE